MNSFIKGMGEFSLFPATGPRESGLEYALNNLAIALQKNEARIREATAETGSELHTQPLIAALSSDILSKTKKQKYWLSKIQATFKTLFNKKLVHQFSITYMNQLKPSLRNSAFYYDRTYIQEQQQCNPIIFCRPAIKNFIMIEKRQWDNYEKQLVKFIKQNKIELSRAEDILLQVIDYDQSMLYQIPCQNDLQRRKYLINYLLLNSPNKPPRLYETKKIFDSGLKKMFIIKILQTLQNLVENIKVENIKVENIKVG